MSRKVTIGFELESVTVAIIDILPLRPVDDTARKRQKYLQIAASIREIGIGQPPVVARRPELKASICCSTATFGSIF